MKIAIKFNFKKMCVVGVILSVRVCVQAHCEMCCRQK